jgi:phosphohistidine phosphatase
MRLFLVRHGHPLPKEEDPFKGLSDRGRQDVARVASHLQKKGVKVEAIWESGKKRATQTAEILALSLTGGKELVFKKPGIEPNDPLETLEEELSGRSGDLMIVGHLPFLSRLVSRLILGKEIPELVVFQPGGVVCMDRDAAGKWAVRWMLVPSML